MGILNLMTFLRNHCPDAIVKIRLPDLRGKRIAIDGNFCMYSSYYRISGKVIDDTDILTSEVSTSQIKYEWYSEFLTFLANIIAAGVVPIVVFDGESPIAKKKKQEESRLKGEAQAAEIKSMIMAIKQGQVPPTREIIKDIKRKMQNYINFTSEDYKDLKHFIADMGIPVIQAEGEAEKTACMLMIDGHAAAVFTKDTDALVYGAGLVITSMYGDSNSIVLNTILKKLNLTQQDFVEVCIMSGCDYNQNIKGIGVKKSYDLISQYKRIENLGTRFSQSQIDELNHEECRRIFTYQKVNIPCKLDIDFSAYAKNCCKYLLSSSSHRHMEEAICQPFTCTGGTIDGIVQDGGYIQCPAGIKLILF